MMGLLVVSLPAWAASYVDEVLKDKPAAYWRFEEAAGAKEAKDHAGSHPGTYHNVGLGHASAAPALGKAASFDGSHVRIDKAPSLTGDVTIECWAKLARLGEGETTALIDGVTIHQGKADSKGKRPPAQFAVTHGDGQGENHMIGSRVEAQPGVWYHLVFVRNADARTCQMFINGFADGPVIRFGQNPGGGSAGELLIGMLDTAGNGRFAGLIDEVAIYTRPLSAERILAHYKAALHSKGLQPVQIAAHRGNSMHAPENTAVAYQEAIDAGADIVELDIQSSKDGVPMLMHDRTLARTTGAKGKTADYTAAQLIAMDAGKWKHERYAGEKVPTLETVARVCKGRAIIFLDLKENGMGRAMADALQRAGVTLDQVIAGPWDDKVAADVQSAMPGVTMMLIGKPPEDWNDAWFEQQKQRGYDALWFNFKATTKEFIDAAHRHGLPVHAWTINDPATLSTAIFAGVDGIVTDDPATLKKLLEELR